MDDPSQRQQEIFDELALAGRYFSRLSGEIKHQECSIAQQIYESILLLQWRLRAGNRVDSQALSNESLLLDALPQPLLIQQSTNGVVLNRIGAEDVMPGA